MDPRVEYAARRNRWQDEERSLARQFVRIGNLRLSVGLAGFAATVFVVVYRWFSAWWLLIPVFVFVGLVVWHRRVIQRRDYARRAIRFYAEGIRRITGEWVGRGRSGLQFSDPEHVYSADLDLFGKGSLFEFVSTARTPVGEQTLANWLLSHAEPEEILARQEAVRELSGRLDLREAVALASEEVRSESAGTRIAGAATSATANFSPALRVVALGLALGALGCLITFFAGVVSGWVLAASLGMNFAFAYALRRRIDSVMEQADVPGSELRTLARLMAELEGAEFEAPRLRRVRESLVVQGVPASKRIERLARWIDILDSSEHRLIRILRTVLLWREQAVMGIATWCWENGRHLPEWMQAAGDFEALSSFASLCFEHPEWAFPVVMTGESRFEANGLKHPLIAPGKCVPNDVSLGEPTRVLLVSGSNMSGKSTLLRAVGLNNVLAWAGAPVAATSLRTSCRKTGASIRIVDSLLDNRSRFFAEILRIRQILQIAHAGEALFLIDEVLSGTNSHDRRIGALAIARGLVDSGAVGLITTHDLALAEIEADLAAAAKNVHFEDNIVNGEIQFDYVLRPGVVTHSNALELMRMVGLKV